jgi:hypothetical protein
MATIFRFREAGCKKFMKLIAALWFAPWQQADMWSQGRRMVFVHRGRDAIERDRFVP